MDKINYNNIILMVLGENTVKATKYIDTNLIVRAVRRRFDKKIAKRHNIEITLTIGKPNYVERHFIKDCIKAREPFPVKKIQLKLLNTKRALHGRNKFSTGK